MNIKQIRKMISFNLESIDYKDIDTSKMNSNDCDTKLQAWYLGRKEVYELVLKWIDEK